MENLYNEHNPRWDVIERVYKDLEELLYKHINDNRLTFLELETIIRLMSLRLLSAEVKHLTSLMLRDLYNKDDTKRCYR